MNLYQIRQEIEQILDSGFVIDEETGEVLADESDLEALSIAEDEKLENCLCYIKNLKAEAEAIKEEESALSRRRKAKEAKVDRLKSYVAEHMKISGKKKFEAARCKASLTTSKSVEIDDEVFFDCAPEEYIRIKKEADKPAIKFAIASGIEIAGASITEKEGLRIG